MTVDEFRAIFPIFDAESFPDAAVEYRLTIAERWFTADIWGDEGLREHAIALYTAHSLAALGAAAVGGDASGSMSAGASGAIASKAVDGASVSFDTGSINAADAASWNATPYGRELWLLLQMFGAGGRQLW